MVSAPPFAADDAQVWDDFDQRSDAWEAEHRPPLPALVEFIERLTARFPCVSELREDQLDSTVWADGPVADGLMHDTAILTLADSKTAAVIPVVRELARALGLAVYDPQSEHVWRP